MRLAGEDPVERWATVRPLALLTGCFTAGLIAGHAAPITLAWALGAAGVASMWLAIFADVGVMVLAVLNAIRTLFTKELHT